MFVKPSTMTGFVLFRHEHPIVPVIREHRTLAKLLNCTLGSICSLARLSMGTQKYTLHGHWLQTSTATGRLSMEEPNLQVIIIYIHPFFFYSDPPNNLNLILVLITNLAFELCSALNTQLISK